MTQASEAIIEIPLDALVESPLNHRRIYNQAKLEELAANIRAEGRIHQPLLVRTVVGPLFEGDANGAVCREIVFGSRRYRAAELAGLATVPCMERQMSDAEVERAQLAENLQREDVHPIEEAEGFQALIERHGETADRIAENVGKSRSHVYGRLKLLQAVPEIRKACLAGEIGSEVALLIARLRTPKLQEKALCYVKGKYISMEDGGAKSYRQIRDLLNEKFTLDLKSAMFDVEDEMLLPSAGHCMRCPKRSANAPEYSDVLAKKNGNGMRASDYDGQRHTGADVCTDPDCFDAKKKAHLAREAAALEAKGKVMVTGNAARNAVSADGEIKGAYVPLAKVKDALKKAKSDVAVVTIQDPRTGKTHQAVKAEDAKAAGVKVPAPKAAAQRHDYEAERQKRETQEKEQNEKAAAETDFRLKLLDKVRAAAAGRERDVVDMQLIARRVWAGVEYEDQRSLAKLYEAKTENGMLRRIGELDAVGLAMFMLDCALIEKVFLTGWEFARGAKADALFDTAKRYGIDADKLRATLSAAAERREAPALAKKKAKAAEAA